MTHIERSSSQREVVEFAGIVAFCLLLWPVAAAVQEPPAAARPLTAAEQEAFLSQAAIVSERRMPGQTEQWRVTLDDGTRKHDAGVETADGTTASRRNYRFNIAAYELDKLLDLRMVVPSVARVVNGRPAAVTWWADEIAMMERDRRAKKIDPPDRELWNNQMDAVRLFDELTSNPYRNLNPERIVSTPADEGPGPDYLWMELLITRAWRVWLIDHTGTFRIRKELQHPETLTRVDRGLLGKLRTLDKRALEQALSRYLSPAQLEALEARRTLLVKHFDDLIASRGADGVLYDLSSRR